jgi:Zinc finger C-x8-C-x5-C-x3-H type (and similar)
MGLYVFSFEQTPNGLFRSSHDVSRESCERIISTRLFTVPYFCRETMPSNAHSTQMPSGFYSAPDPRTANPPPPPPPPPSAPPWSPMPPYGGAHQYGYNYSNSGYNNYYNPPQATTEGPASFANGPQQVHSQLYPSPPIPSEPSRQAPPSTTTMPYRCQPCNLTLESATALQAHTSSHVSCTECDFCAAPKIVKGHFSAVHGKFAGAGYKTVTIAIPGLPVQRFNICVGNRPQDIQRWIAERRQRFPRQLKPAATVNDVSKPNIGAATSGLSSLLEGYGSSSSEDEGEVKEGLVPPARSSTAPTVGANANATQTTTTDAPRPSYRTRPCRYFMRNGQCRNGDQCNYSHDRLQFQSPHDGPANPSLATTDRANGATASAKRQRTNESAPPVAYSNSKSSLLYKLLTNDMKRETILTLQLLDHIVESNFFQQEPGTTHENIARFP